VAVNGGAVELAWTVRTEDGRPVVNPATQGIASVRLCLQDCAVMDGSLCTGETLCPFQTFPFDRFRGATDFAIAPGRKKLWITLGCTDSQVTAVVTVPEPLLREVTKGDVTELNALLISVPSEGPACGQGNGA
jgi:hypothetical protein